MYNYGRNLNPSLWAWGSGPKPNGYSKFDDGMCFSSNFGGKSVGINSSHCSTVERLYAWEKKLYQEVKV